MGSVQRVRCSPVPPLVHDPMVQVEAASSQHSTPAGHHPIGFLLSEDEGAGIIYRDALGAVRWLPLCLAGHLHHTCFLCGSLETYGRHMAGGEGGVVRGGGQIGLEGK